MDKISRLLALDHNLFVDKLMSEINNLLNGSNLELIIQDNYSIVLLEKDTQKKLRTIGTDLRIYE